MFRIINKAILCFLTVFPSQLIAQQNSAANAKIVVDSYSLEKGPVIPIGVLIELDKDWHIYWRNPGDSGMPTSIDFNFPDGVTVSEIKWPEPKAFEYDGLASYGYEKQVLLLADLSISESFNLSYVEITADLKSLICRDVCIPFNTTVSTEIDLKNNFKSANQISELFSKTRNKLPEVNHKIDFSVMLNDDFIILQIHNPEINSAEIESLYFLPYDNGIFKNSIDQKFFQKENKTELVVDFDNFRIEEPKEIYGLLVYDFGKAKKVYEVKQLISSK